MSTKGKSKGDDQAPAFDESLGRLEEIVSELEGGGLGLEESLARYKEGVSLLEGCRSTLTAFRAQVEELRPDGGASPIADPDVDDEPADGIDAPF
ncbi:MAG: exodeoxyribonuclease VII small subunit [Planctomycetota bacterium]|nr:exodeoxyribonuclease VII small subunit [Planctomycetota bacterium]MEC8510734.1 exodeoxyribonuclease VII small subunit [Planctomycetota bacterium]